MQAVAATSGSRIVECDLQIIVSQEPIEGGPCLFAPAALSRGAISLQTCRDHRTGFHRLLIEARLLARLGIKALRSDGDEMALELTMLDADQPIQGFESRRNHLF